MKKPDSQKPPTATVIAGAVNGQTQQQIADELGVSRSTVYRRHGTMTAIRDAYDPMRKVGK